jgi:nitrite reductase/ring-hydroxylating ferredoxin subunit
MSAGVEVRVADVAELALGEARKFAFERDGEQQEGFVLRHASGLFAYHNRCPHWQVDLDMGEGRFYSAVVDRIFCSSHGALFEPTTGYCDAGPCVGEALERFELRVEGTAAVVTIPG